jgi:hypothetical protein
VPGGFSVHASQGCHTWLLDLDTFIVGFVQIVSFGLMHYSYLQSDRGGN